MLERLPDSERYETDGYGVYEWQSHNKHMVEKCGAVNRNEAPRSMLRGKLNRLTSQSKGYAKSVEMPANSLALVFCDKLNAIPSSHTPALVRLRNIPSDDILSAYMLLSRHPQRGGGRISNLSFLLREVGLTHFLC